MIECLNGIVAEPPLLDLDSRGAIFPTCVRIEGFRRPCRVPLPVPWLHASLGGATLLAPLESDRLIKKDRRVARIQIRDTARRMIAALLTVAFNPADGSALDAHVAQD